VGNTAGEDRILARNETSKSSTHAVAAGETRSAAWTVTTRRERPATSREALCEGSKPLNEMGPSTPHLVFGNEDEPLR